MYFRAPFWRAHYGLAVLAMPRLPSERHRLSSAIGCPRSASTQRLRRFGRFDHLCSTRYGDGEIRARKSSQDGEVHPDHLSAGVEYRPTGPAGSCLRVVDQSIRANNAKMTLGYQRPDQLSPCKLLHKTLRVVPDCLCDPFDRRLVEARKNPFDSRGVTNQDDRTARDRGLLIDCDRPRVALRQID